MSVSSARCETLGRSLRDVKEKALKEVQEDKGREVQEASNRQGWAEMTSGGKSSILRCQTTLQSHQGSSLSQPWEVALLPKEGEQAPASWPAESSKTTSPVEAYRTTTPSNCTLLLAKRFPKTILRLPSCRKDLRSWAPVGRALHGYRGTIRTEGLSPHLGMMLFTKIRITT